MWEKIKDKLLIGGIIIFAVVLYMCMPRLLIFAINHSKGLKGLLFLGGMSVVLTIVYYLFGYRKMELVKIALLILFVAIMIWLYFNYRNIDILISSRYGQGVATFVCLVIFFLIWLISKFLI